MEVNTKTSERGHKQANRQKPEGRRKHQSHTIIQGSGIDRPRPINELPSDAIHRSGNRGLRSAVHGGPRKDGKEGGVVWWVVMVEGTVARLRAR